MKANCPHCGSLITGLRLSATVGTAENGTTWNCLVFACSTCNKAISADIDLTAVRNDVIGEIRKHR